MPMTVWLLRSRRLAINAPIRPSPTNPSCINYSFLSRLCWSVVSNVVYQCLHITLLQLCTRFAFRQWSGRTNKLIRGKNTSSLLRFSILVFWRQCIEGEEENTHPRNHIRAQEAQLTMV